MERQQELRALLKRWEAEFLRERRRKPRQADIEEAPEETRRQYREYAALKRARSSAPTPKTPETPKAEQVEDSGFWGSHLNRAPKIPGRSRSGSAGPGISAEFYGMKLKAKLGTTGKEPPLTPNLRRIPKIPRSQKNPEREAEVSPPEPTRNEEKPENPKNPEEFGDLVLPISVPGLGLNPQFSPNPEKFQRLKRKVAETLGSLDPGWIQRCQESPKKREIPTRGKEGIDPESDPKPDPKSDPKSDPESFGNSGRKRPREGAEEAPVKSRRRSGSDRGIFGIGTIQEDEEEEKSQKGAEDGLGKTEKNPKSARKTRAPPRNGGNYVCLNLKRKTYSRASLRGKFLRKQIWKQKWRKKFGAGADVCFRCGGKGHWASECREKDLGSFPEKIPEEEEETLLTLEEVARRSSGVLSPEVPGGESGAENSQLGPNSLDSPPPEFSPPPPPVDPLYPPNPDGTIPDPPEEVLDALRTLGYESFRPGQAEAIMRVLSGISTLVVLSTGMGKSLCYQLPAFLYHRNSRCISLVISPLVSLMDDQVSGLPSALKAVCVHSNLSQSQREAAMEKVRSGRAQILLLSPEALVGAGAFSRLFRHLPPVAFACLDEVHCISQWSHNFRPAYLRVCKVLRERLGVRCFLGLTATATAATAREVAQHLGMEPGKGLGIRAAGIPDNLRLSVSMDADRDKALLWLLRSWAGPVIVYCTRREQSERLAELIQRELPEKNPEKPGKGQGGEFRVSAAYHAGLAPRQRRRIQRDFMANRIRVLCATVSFGMGLDKRDVRGVVHYNLPGSLEGFLQEIGRAGRDGEPARCHLLLQPEGEDLLELRRHVHENSVDFLAVRTLIRQIFAPCKCPEIHGKIQENSQEKAEFPKNRRICRGHRRAVPVRELVESLDLRAEAIETLLALLELHPGRLLRLLPAPRCCPQRPRRGTAPSCPAPAGEASGIPGIPGIPASDAAAPSGSGGRESTGGRHRAPGNTSELHPEFQEFSFHFRACGDLDPRELESLSHSLHSRLLRRERAELRRLRRCFQTFHSVAVPSCVPAAPESRRLRELLREYLEEETTENEEGEGEPDGDPGISAEEEEEARAEIRKLLAAHPGETFTGRAVARIFHGIGSPRFPAREFGRDRRFWRRLLRLEFRSLSRLAAQEILAWR